DAPGRLCLGLCQATYSTSVHHAFRELAAGSPVHAIQHQLLKSRGLKTPRIMAEQQHKDVALTVLTRPPQGKSAAWHVFGLPCWPPGMCSLCCVSRNKDVIALSERQAHVQLIGGLEVRYPTHAGMAWSTHLDCELPIGRMKTRARNPPPTGNRMIFW